MSEDLKRNPEKRELKDIEKNNVANDNLLLEEVLRGYRIVFLSEDNFIRKLFDIDSIRIYDKTLLNVGRYGDQMFTKERNRLLKDPEYLTHAEQKKILKERGIWSDEEERKMNDMRAEIDEMILERDVLFERIEKAEQKKDKAAEKTARKNLEELGKRMSKIHMELLELTDIYVTYFRDTIEMRAKLKQHMGWIVSAVCRNEGDDEYDETKRLWKDVESIEKDLDDMKLSALLNECNSFWNVEKPEDQSFFVESPDEQILDSDGDSQKK